jgi:hypothetical protein
MEMQDMVELGTTDRPMTLLPVFTGEAFARLVQYPIIVEMWDKIAGKNAGGRRKRAYLAEFDEGQRRLISYWYTRFYRWHLTTGTPQRVVMRLATLQLIQRAVHFFATV